jgi:hypothetical protein
MNGMRQGENRTFGRLFPQQLMHLEHAGPNSSGSTLIVARHCCRRRFLSMQRHKCSACGRDAFAYRLEEDGTKTYLCLDHLPTGKAPDPNVAAPRRDANSDKPNST